MKIITAQEFINFCDQEILAWENNKKGIEIRIPKYIIKKLEKDFDLKGMAWPEWSKFDLTVGGKRPFKNINYISKRETGKFDLDKDDYYYPSEILILLEHENNISDCWREMIKLTYKRAKLKVLITYSKYESVSGEVANEVRLLSENFQTIIKQSNEIHREEPNTEYLLIVGLWSKDKIQNWKLSWYKKYVFDIYGKYKPIK